MAKQNIYDNDVFFEDFSRRRGDEINFNDCIEAPILLSMLPELSGRSVLDIGCGMGQHARQYAEMGAASVLGVDISEKMLAFAREHNSAENIEYRRLAFEELGSLERTFDIVTSSLAFDYAEDLGSLMRDIRALLSDGGRLVFSMSHPVETAYDGQYPRYTRDADGKRLYTNLNNYFIEGRREIKWVVDKYELYHRTLETLINSVIDAGFIIERCRESRTSDELRERYPDMFGGTLHRPVFIFFRCRGA